MKNKPLFSVIIPTYNRASLIPFTLNSVLEQTFFDFEVIIIDDGSTDNTTEIIQPYLADRRVYYYKIKNSERSAARNYGVQKSAGRYVTFLDSDDLFLPWHLKTAHQKIEETNSAPIFHLAYEILHSNGHTDQLPELPSPVNEKLLEGNFLSCIGVFLQRDVALENRFDENLSRSEDYELWMRIASRMPILIFNEVTSRLINHNERSVSTTDIKKLIEQSSSVSQKLTADPFFIKRFGNKTGKFNSFRILYLSLHLAISGERWRATKGLLHTLYLYPYVIFTYRFIVVCKKIILW